MQGIQLKMELGIKSIVNLISQFCQVQMMYYKKDWNKKILN